MLRRAIVTRERGQAAVLLALAFILLVGFLGLALDGANAFGQRRRVANAADAAALAATRALIAERSRGDGGTQINQLIDAFLTERHDLDGATISWRAFYVERLDLEGSRGEVTDGARPPAAADGVRVEVLLTFPTYFMGVFGQRSLEVSGSGTAVYGPLGTAVGQDLAPLALSPGGLQLLKDEEEARIDLKDFYSPDNFIPEYLDPMNPDLGFVDGGALPDDVITTSNFAHVSFSEYAGAPATGDDCGEAEADSLTAWWCGGSPNKLRINRELPHGGADWDELEAAIEWRIANRPLVVLPVYGDIGIYYELVNFVAVELTELDSDGRLHVELVEDYATAGAMLGDGSGVETGVWAVNLTR